MIAVAVALVLVASIAMLLDAESAAEAERTGRRLETLQADYLAQAALQHALWKNDNNRCVGGPGVPATGFGTHSYLATLSSPATTSEYSLTPDRDAWIKEAVPTENNGGATELSVKNKTGDSFRSLYHFDLSAVATGERVVSATLRLYQTAGDALTPVSVHAVNAPWTETDATWDSVASSFDADPWGEIRLTANDGTWVAVNVTGLAQWWVNAPTDNHGIMLIATSDDDESKYASREYSAGLQPYLEVTTASADIAPVSIVATGTLASGVTRTLSRAMAPAHQPANTAVLRPDEAASTDTYLYEWKPTWNYGINASIWSDDSFADSTATGLVKFELVSIPRGARVLSAELELFQDSPSASGGPIGVHRVLAGWDEGAENQGLGPGANWTQRTDLQLWTTPGGDYEATADAVATVAVGAVAPVTWDVTGLVTGWVSGRYENHGLAVVAETPGAAAYFASSADADPTRRPKLTVTYACACGSACLGPRGSGAVLMLVANDNNPTSGDEAKIDLFESWGYTVTLEDDNAGATAITNLMETHDVLYVASSVDPTVVGTKLTNLAAPVVSEVGELADELGFATGAAWATGDTASVVDSSHYITRPFAAGPLAIYDAPMERVGLSGTPSPDLTRLADFGVDVALATLDTGSLLATGGSAPDRRVMLPFGPDPKLDWNFVNADGRLILQRALAWGAQADAAGAGGNLLMVVVNLNNPTSQETQKRSLIEGWGYSVALIDESDPQSAYDAALAANDVVFVGEDVASGNVATKLTGASIGVVTEEANLSDELGLSAGIGWDSGTSIEVNDNTHFITSPFGLGPLTILSASESLAYVTGTEAPDLQKLASSSSGFGVVTLESGATTHTGGMAAGRRVMLPWGGNDMDVGNLTTEGLAIFERALEWGSTTGGGMIQVPVAGPDDDAEENTTLGVMYVDSSDLELAVDGITSDLVGIRFANVAIPAGAQIASAYIQFQVDEATTGAADLVIRGQAADDAAPFTTAGYDISSRPVTTANVSWLPPAWPTVGERGPDQRTPELAPVIEEIVDRPGWSSGNALAVIIDGIGERTAEAYEGDPAGAAVLHIEFSGGGGGGGGGPTGPIAHWKLDDGTGTTAIDSVGGHDGTLANGPAWIAGHSGAALVFDGADDYVDLTSDNELDDVFVSGATVMAWIWPTGWGENGYGRLFDKSSSPSSTGDGWAIRLNVDNGGLNFGQGFTGGRGWWRLPNDSITLDAWQHVAVAYDASSTANDPVIYLNGAAVDVIRVDAPSGDVRSDASINLRLGNHAGGTAHTFEGVIDDARVYDRMLSAAEIADLAAGGGGGGGCDASYADDFETDDYGGSTGTLTWATDWLEINESDGPSGGDEQVVSGPGGFVARVQDNDGGGEGLEREADLSGHSVAVLSFTYWRGSLDDVNDYVTVDVSSDGGGTWTEIDRFTGPASDPQSSPQSASYDISSFVAPNTRVRLLTSPNMGNTDRVFFDDFEIALSGCP